MKKLFFFMIVVLISLSVSGEENSEKTLLKFVYLPTHENYEAAVKVVERENFNIQKVPYDFFPIFDELIESSDLLAFNLLKKIAKKTELYSSTLETVRNLMLKDFDFFLNNIDDLDSKTTGKLVIDEFMETDDTAEIYKFYSEILNKTNEIKSGNIAKNASKIKQIVKERLNNETLKFNIDSFNKASVSTGDLCSNIAASTNALVKFVCVPNKTNYIEALLLLGSRDFSAKDIPDVFSERFRKLIENSNVFAFNILKKIVSENILQNYISMDFKENVRNLMLKDIEFFLNNINELNEKEIKELFVGGYLARNKTLKNYKFYSAILDKIKHVEKKELTKNAVKIDKIIRTELNDEFMTKVKNLQKSEVLANKFCEKYGSNFAEFTNFVTRNISELKERILDPISYCEIMYGSDNPYLLYHEYMFDLISQKISIIEQPTKSYMTVINKNLAKLGGIESKEKAEYRAFIYGFFGDPKKFLKKLKEKPSFFMKSAALDLALIVSCCGKISEYETARENLRKVSGKDCDLLLEELISETEKILKTENRFECNGFCGKRVMIF